MKGTRCISFLLMGIVLSLVSLSSSAQELDSGYYDETCNDFEEIVTQKMKQWFNRDNTIAASLMRLHFHDCAVRGCDASILLDYPGSERTSVVSKTLRGFEVIDDIKAALEKKCPKTVSCADILTAAARDATVMLKGPYWSNSYGRTDGRQSYADEATQMVPRGNETMTELIEFYQSKGLTVLDLVVLSGAHSVGRSTCGAIQERLYNFKGTGEPDPTIDNQYLIYLRRKCNRKSSVYVNLDASTPDVFDNAYYKNLQMGHGLLYTDQLLQLDHRTSELVSTLAEENNVFPYMFSSSMVKLANIIEDDDDGEVRITCSKVNGYSY